MTTTLRKLIEGIRSNDWDDAVIRVEAEDEWGTYYGNLDDPYGNLDKDDDYEPEAKGWKAPLPYLGPLADCPSSILDVEFTTGYGSPQRPCWTVWMPQIIATCTEYDGSTSFTTIRRNPPTEFPS
jgi:hypothetical protein